jgi:hypothetical protein
MDHFTSVLGARPEVVWNFLGNDEILSMGSFAKALLRIGERRTHGVCLLSDVLLDTVTGAKLMNGLLIRKLGRPRKANKNTSVERLERNLQRIGRIHVEGYGP